MSGIPITEPKIKSTSRRVYLEDFNDSDSDDNDVKDNKNKYHKNYSHNDNIAKHQQEFGHKKRIKP